MSERKLVGHILNMMHGFTFVLFPLFNHMISYNRYFIGNNFPHTRDKERLEFYVSVKLACVFKVGRTCLSCTPASYIFLYSVSFH